MSSSSLRATVQRFAEEEAIKHGLLEPGERLSVSLRVRKTKKSVSLNKRGGYHWIRTGEEITEDDWVTILSLNFKSKRPVIEYFHRTGNKPIERDTAAFMIGRVYWTNNMDEINKVFEAAGMMIRLLKAKSHADSYDQLYDCVCLFKVRRPT